jgi:hypothetical protein
MFYPAIVVSLIGIVTFTLLGIVKFSKKKAAKKTAIIAGAVVVSMAITVFFGEEMPRQIQLSRHVISENIIVGEGTEWQLNGILTIPRNADGLVPAVVLVHGSGSGDMDATIFDNKPFRDIAEYLSSNGIAVIRYNKRSLTHGMRMAAASEQDGGFTVWEETIEDALLATELLRADSRIDSEQIYILGHSIGGMLAPRIHELGGNYAGIITFAGSPRFLLDISLTQNIAYLESLPDGEEREAIATLIEQWDEYYGAYLALPDEEAKNTLIPNWGGITAYYLRDMYENPAAMFIEQITVPFLIMHPDDDVQVLTEIDFAIYQELLADRDNVTFRLYPGLNHLFMPSLGFDISEILDEYRVRANVDEQVLRDIVEWVHSDSK